MVTSRPLPQALENEGPWNAKSMLKRQNLRGAKVRARTHCQSDGLEWMEVLDAESVSHAELDEADACCDGVATIVGAGFA